MEFAAGRFAELRSAGRDEGVRPYLCRGGEIYWDWLTRLTIIVIALCAARAAPSCQPIM